MQYQIINLEQKYLFFNFTEYLINLLIITILIFFTIRFLFIIFFCKSKYFVFTTNELSHRLLKRFLFAPWNFVLKKFWRNDKEPIDSDVLFTQD